MTRAISPPHPTRVCVDPGVRNCGIVIFRGGSILHAETLHPAPRARGTRGALTQPQAVAAALIVARRVLELAATYDAIEVVVEEFGDIPGRRNHKARWTTPLAVGALAAELDRAGLPLVLQPASRQGSSRGQRLTLRALWESGTRGAVPGDRALETEHEISAALHGVARLADVRPGAVAR